MGFEVTIWRFNTSVSASIGKFLNGEITALTFSTATSTFQRNKSLGRLNNLTSELNMKLRSVGSQKTHIRPALPSNNSFFCNNPLVFEVCFTRIEWSLFWKSKAWSSHQDNTNTTFNGSSAPLCLCKQSCWHIGVLGKLHVKTLPAARPWETGRPKLAAESEIDCCTHRQCCFRWNWGQQVWVWEKRAAWMRCPYALLSQFWTHDWSGETIKPWTEITVLSYLLVSQHYRRKKLWDWLRKSFVFHDLECKVVNFWFMMLFIQIDMGVNRSIKFAGNAQDKKTICESY